MTRSRTLSVWLLKEGFDPESALVDDHGLTGPEDAGNLPPSASLYISSRESAAPWWRTYFAVKKELKQRQAGAVLFLKASDRWFAVTFGSASSKLKPESHEYDFGLLVTLNSVDPNKLKNTDIASPALAVRQRTQVPVGADLTHLQFRQDDHVLKKLAGSVSDEVKEKFGFSSVTGSSQVRLSTKKSSSELPALCSALLEIYGQDSYRKTFPDVRNVRPVVDPDILCVLNDGLIENLAAETTSVEMSLPEIVGDDVGQGFRFQVPSIGHIFDSLDLPSYFQQLQEAGMSPSDLTWADLKRHKVVALDGNDNVVRRYSLHRCLSFDYTIPETSRKFYLLDGEWFEVEGDYVARVRSRLEKVFVDLSAPPMESGVEADYNRLLAEALDGICLDATNVSPRGVTQVEPCDVLVSTESELTFNHVKVGTGSATLSHLFNQGQVSYSLLVSEPEARDKLKDLIEDAQGGPSASAEAGSAAAVVSKIQSRVCRVRYVVVTPKNPDAGVDNLPFFSQVSLSRAVQLFESMDVPVEIGFLPDSRVKAEPRKKKRKSSRAT